MELKESRVLLSDLREQLLAKEDEMKKMRAQTEAGLGDRVVKLRRELDEAQGTVDGLQGDLVDAELTIDKVSATTAA